MAVDVQKLGELYTRGGKVFVRFLFGPDQGKTVQVAYRSQRMDEWWHSFGQDISQAQNFRLTSFTDFNRMDFTDIGTSPTASKKTQKAGHGNALFLG